jgi:ADP-ribosyl-[dinitrogen reductase] hydrolase
MAAALQKHYSYEGDNMKGSCLCKTVTYEVDKLASSIQHCACRTCRKAHAAAFNSAAAVKPADFRWTAGQDALKSFESSPGKRRYFCSVCGSHLLASREGKPYLILRVATLDDDPGVRPEFMIWKSHAAPWLTFDDAVPAHAEWQPGHQ